MSEPYVGSWVQGYLDQLTAEIGVEQRVGSAEEARLGAPPRMTWVPPAKGGARIVDAPFAIAGADCIVWEEAGFVVTIWASSVDELYSMRWDLWRALDKLYGPPMGRPALDGDPARPGYDLSDPSDIIAVETVAGSVACVQTATIRYFVDRGQYAPGPPIVSVPQTTTLGAIADDPAPDVALEQTLEAA